MRTSNTFAILFWAHTTRTKNNKTPIYVRITVNGKRANFSLKHRADIRTWDSKRQKAKGNSESARILNGYLNQVHSQIFECYKDLKLKGKLITAELIKAEYLGESDDSKTLQNLLEYHKKKTEKTLSIGTLRNFGVTERYINRYLSQKMNTSDVYLKELDYKFICDFANFLHC
ncbi:MAG: site-specific integrase, partial [Chloroflexi bacterium]|nr:site-specific integrase [Chloroflexota bacterium]